MFKRIALNVSGLAFVLATLIAVTLAACGDSSTSDPGGSLPVSSSSNQPPPSSGLMEDGSPTIEAHLSGMLDHVLTVSCQVRTTSTEHPIGYVAIYIEGDNGELFRQTGSGRIVSIDDFQTMFQGEEHCGPGISFRVCSNYYISGGPHEGGPYQGPCTLPLTRDITRCITPSSSSVASSSSVTEKHFTPAGEGTFTLNSLSGNRGLMLSSSPSYTDNAIAASLYFEIVGLDSYLKTNSSVKIIDVFDFMTGGQGGHYNTGIYSTGSGINVVSNPSSTLAFPIPYAFDTDNTPDNEVYYFDGKYYMVRTNNGSFGASAVEWTTNDYLVFGSTPASGIGSNKTIEIKVWKIN